MKYARLMSIALVCLGLSGCLAVVAGGAAAGGYMVGKDERSAGQIATDARISSAVKTALIREEDVKARNINVDTMNNHVTLNGHVSSTGEETLAVKIAKSVKDVNGVTSKLEVIPVEVEERD